MITEASPILNLLLAKGVGTKTLSEIVDKLVTLSLSPDEIGIAELAEELHWREDLKANSLAVQEQANSLAEQLERQQVRILVRGFDRYPRKLSRILGKNAPPVLFAKGNLSLLTAKAVGFCGSRHASDKGIHVAAESARQLGENGIDVVSGYAKGVDLAAHCAALEAGGTTTIVLAEGILHFRPKREIKSLLTEENYLILSEYSPRLPWAARNAMQRNSTIIGLSDAMIVIESGTTGGTHACAESALRLKHPLFVVEYAVPAESAGGNQHFLSKGAQALRGDRQGRPNLSRVYAALGINAASETLTTEVAPDFERVDSNNESGASVSRPHQDQQNFTPSFKDPVDTHKYPKRLIEIDLPIARISAHSRWEKKSVPGHIKQIHLWWARRPLAACRAVICAALWPDPADLLCPIEFRVAATAALQSFAKRVFPDRLTEEGHQLQETISCESRERWEAMSAGALTFDPSKAADMPVLRLALMDFIADFANWENAAVSAYLETSQEITDAAHTVLGNARGTRPLVVDPFAGGASIPVEAVRVGGDVFASDLNPVAVLLNKVALEYLPKYGNRLSEELRRWGRWIQDEAKKQLAPFYPKDPDGAIPIAYLWARTVKCEGPNCGVDVPLIRSFWLTKKSSRTAAFRIVPNYAKKQVDFEIIDGPIHSDLGQPTVKRGSATCPICGFTTPVASVRRQLKARKGGANDARLFCVARVYSDRQGRYYRVANVDDLAAVTAARQRLTKLKLNHTESLALVPNEPTPQGGGSGAGRAFSQRIYGMDSFEDLFSDRQALSLSTFARLINTARLHFSDVTDEGLVVAVETVLALNLTKLVDLSTSLGAWEPNIPTVQHLFGRAAIGMCWDFAEGVTIGEGRGSWINYLEKMADVLQKQVGSWAEGHAEQMDASNLSLPNDSVDLFCTDPPYYDAVPYADLSDLFYVWLRRALYGRHELLFRADLTPKGEECIVDEVKGKDAAYFEMTMRNVMAHGRRVVKPTGIGILVFAHKSTAGWEAQLQAMIDAGWIITGSWPIDTENASRLRAQSSAALASSVHIVCRPREDINGEIVDCSGEWRDVLGELPKRIHEWMPRLATEGVVGADAIFACLGPALEIFSRYSRVEKANGETATLREYLEHVWAAVSTEALSLIFKDANAAGLEPDARLTAMWLWTIGGGGADGNGKRTSPKDEDEAIDGEGTDDGDDEEPPGTVTKGKAAAGFLLEYDAARKIAQGLGVHLEQCESFVEIKGDRARLLPVAERTPYLFGKGTQAGTSGTGRKKKVRQKTLFAELDDAEAAEAGWTDLKGPPPGATVLDRVHQSMILFAANRAELLKRFLVEDGVGKDARFWKLADNLNKLYPPGTDERRWIEGVLARKKGLGQ